MSFFLAVVAGKKLCIPQLECDQVALLYTGHSSLVLHLCTIKTSKQYMDAHRRFVKPSLTYFPLGQTLYLFAIAFNIGIWIRNIYRYFFYCLAEDIGYAIGVKRTEDSILEIIRNRSLGQIVLSFPI